MFVDCGFCRMSISKCALHWAHIAVCLETWCKLLLEAIVHSAQLMSRFYGQDLSVRLKEERKRDKEK